MIDFFNHGSKKVRTHKERKKERKKVRKNREIIKIRKCRGKNYIQTLLLGVCIKMTNQGINLESELIMTYLGMFGKKKIYISYATESLNNGR